MVKKTITYKDFNDVERTEDFYFNISKPEIIKWQLEEGYGLEEEINKLTKSSDNKKAIEIFEKLLSKAYGIKSEDGKRFMKSDEISRSFTETNAYEKLYMELAYDDKKAADFINGIAPKLSDEDRRNLELAKEKMQNKSVNN